MRRSSRWVALGLALLGCSSKTTSTSTSTPHASASASAGPSATDPDGPSGGKVVLVAQQPTLPPVGAATLSPDGRFVAFAGPGETLLVDTLAGVGNGVVGALPGCAESVAFTGDGKHLFVVDCPHEFVPGKVTPTSRVWDLEHDVVTTMSVEVERQDEHFATRGADLLHWGGPTLSLVHADTHEGVNLRVKWERVNAAAFTKDGAIVAWSSERNKLTTFSKLGELLGSVKVDADGEGVFNDQGDLLLTHSGTHVYVIDAGSGAVLHDARFCDDYGPRLGHARFSSDGKHVLIGCGEHRDDVTLHRASLELTDVVDGPLVKDVWNVDVRAGFVGLTGKAGTTFIDENTLKAVEHFDVSAYFVTFAADGKRALVGDGILDREQRKFTWSLGDDRRHADLTHSGAGRIGFTVRQGYASRVPGFMDVATGRVTIGVALSESGRGAYVPTKKKDSLEIVDPTTLARSTIPSPIEKPYTSNASPAGTHLVTSGLVRGRGGPWIEVIVVGADGKQRSFEILAPDATFVLDDADKLAASTQVSTNAVGGSIRIDRLDDPDAHLTFPVSTLTNKSFLKFSPDGAYLFVDNDLYELATPKRAWRVTADDGIAFLADKPFVLAMGDKNTRVLDRATGKELRVLEGMVALRGSSDDGEYVVMQRDQGFVLLDTATFSREVKLPFDLKVGILSVSPGGGFVWLGSDEGLVCYRVADGRRLIWPGGRGPITDEFVFDPADAENVPVRARRGVNLLKSKLEPLSASSPLAHPNLFVDFFAGKPVSPAP